nr:hypothetical protein GCM10020092_086940 [Actinoplanes digitatis]
MPGTTGTARQEAERLVATVLAMVAEGGAGAARPGRDDSSGTPGLGDLLSGVVGQFLGGDRSESGAAGQQNAGQHGGWATGSAECCVCPVCRAIAGLRNPTAESAERLASGAGDVASGLARMLRGLSAISSAAGVRSKPQPPPRPTPTPDEAWSAATRGGTARPAERIPTEQDVREGADPWTAATRTPRPAPDPKPSSPETPAAAGKAPVQDGSADPGADADDSGPVVETRPTGDPWAAATRTPGRLAPTRRPGAPRRPVAPESSAPSGRSSATGRPATPEHSAAPERPGTPGRPAASAQVVTPEQSVAPGAAVVSEHSVAPDAAVVPEHSAAPDAVVVPEQAEAAEVPDAAEQVVAAERPVTPEPSAASERPGVPGRPATSGRRAASRKPAAAGKSGVALASGEAVAAEAGVVSEQSVASGEAEAGSARRGAGGDFGAGAGRGRRCCG